MKASEIKIGTEVHSKSGAHLGQVIKVEVFHMVVRSAERHEERRYEIATAQQQGDVIVAN